MRIVFMGSDSIACPSLDRLAARSTDTVHGVISQPPRPKGRKRAVSPCPLHARATALGIATLTPDTINSDESVATVRAWAPDLIVVLAYGQILHTPILALPPHGCINLHASLLPNYRGAAPIQWALANGERETGVTTMYMTEKMDAGDIILQQTVPIRDDDTAATLHDRLAETGSTLLDQTLDLAAANRVTRRPQNEEDATYAPKLKKEDGRIDWSACATDIHNRVRGFTPWPGCFCLVPKPTHTALKVLRTRVENGTGEPGAILEISHDGLLVQTGRNAVRLLEVQPAGKRPMGGGAYAQGRSFSAGEKLA